MRPVITFVTLVLSLCVSVGLAAADRRFHPVPGRGKATPLAVRVVAYDGATNGKLSVELTNRSDKTATFSAEGLYFVPDGDPDTAPQRLGAVGPLQIGRGDARRRVKSVAVAAGETVAVTLDVFCIDSHRSSPSSANTFTVGKTRMPRALAKQIADQGHAAASRSGGYAAPAAKAAIQEQVWKTRDRAWTPLDGEGAQEQDK